MTKKILLIEDDADIATISGELLRSAGLDVLVATSVEKAIAACAETTPDLALVDIRLPGQNGFEFVRRVRADDRFHDMRVAIYTVHEGEAALMAEAEELGVDAYLSKSQTEVLVDSVRRLLATPV
ncbi:MAG: response regulator [Actinomycetota bacterium]|nr:response regulator [Actinomycetota bacterium]